MKFALTREEHIELIDLNFRRGYIALDIATFCCSGSFEMLERLEKAGKRHRVRLLVGLPQMDQDKHLANACAYGSLKGVDVRSVYNSHLKLWLFRRNVFSEWTAIVGGRNLGNSTWDDLTVEIKGCGLRKLATLFNGVWRRGEVPDFSPFAAELAREQLKKRPF
jgi:hypothetical protein